MHDGHRRYGIAALTDEVGSQNDFEFSSDLQSQCNHRNMGAENVGFKRMVVASAKSIGSSNNRTSNIW